VQKIEAGRRKVSVGEAEALTRIFGATIERLTWPGRVASATALLDMTIARAQQAWKDIARATGTLLWCQGQLGTIICERDGYLGSDEIRALADEARTWKMKSLPSELHRESLIPPAGLHSSGHGCLTLRLRSSLAPGSPRPTPPTNAMPGQLDATVAYA
jgi:hypothetical protein